MATDNTQLRLVFISHGDDHIPYDMIEPRLRVVLGPFLGRPTEGTSKICSDGRGLFTYIGERRGLFTYIYDTRLSPCPDVGALGIVMRDPPR